jgi:membrane protein
MSDPSNNTPRTRGTYTGFLIDLARFGWTRLINDNAPEMAAALAYRTLFSLIPVLVISLVIFKAFLSEKDMKNALGQLLEYTGIDKIQLSSDGQDPSKLTLPDLATDTPPAEPPANPEAEPPAEKQPDRDPPAQPTLEELAEDHSTRLSDTLQEFIDKTVSRIQGINFSVITIVGVLVLIYAALSLVIQVEQAFNTICRAPTGRSLRTRLPAYFTLLVAGPILLVGGFVLSRTVVQTLTDISPWIGTPLRIVSTVGITWLLVLLAYWQMPNARIRLQPAAIGAFIAAVLWEGAKAALTWFVAYLVDPKTGGQIAVYGSLALLPIFLMWVYITWLIVLFGFEVTYSVQTVASGRHRFLDRMTDHPIVDPALGVVIMRALSQRFEEGRPCTTEELARRTATSEVIVQRVLQHLIAKGFVHKVEQRKDADEEAYAIARSPELMTAADVLASMHDLAGEPPSDGKVGIADLSVLRLLRKSQLEAMRTLKIAGLIEKE